MRECNECEAFRCKRIESKWPDIRADHMIPQWQMCQHCSSFVPPKEYAQPMLIHLLNDPRKVGVLNELLTSFELHIQEKPHYPHFELYTKKRKGGGRGRKHRRKGKSMVVVSKNRPQDNRGSVQAQKESKKRRVYEVPKKSEE